jgi:CO/xanthine dehydrogenase Mo-binding subunit
LWKRSSVISGLLRDRRSEVIERLHNIRFHQNRPPTILDAPQRMTWDALNIPDPETPVGARGIGEPPVGGACAAVLNAISDALGDEIFRRAPVMLDTILTSLEAGRPVSEPLTAHI